jgi:hypothetical protein
MEEIETMKNNESVFINIFNEVKRQTNKQISYLTNFTNIFKCYQMTVVPKERKIKENG